MASLVSVWQLTVCLVNLGTLSCLHTSLSSSHPLLSCHDQTMELTEYPAGLSDKYSLWYLICSSPSSTAACSTGSAMTVSRPSVDGSWSRMASHTIVGLLPTTGLLFEYTWSRAAGTTLLLCKHAIKEAENVERVRSQSIESRVTHHRNLQRLCVCCMFFLCPKRGGCKVGRGHTAPAAAAATAVHASEHGGRTSLHELPPTDHKMWM
jgi:hypothetical protein